MPSIAENIGDYIKEYQSNNLFSGAVLISKQSEIIYCEGHGKASYELGVPITSKTKFRIGSITKTFTAVSILQLVDKGLLKLDDRIEKFFPSQREGDKITISHLLSHTSGIQNYTENPTMNEWANVNVSPDEIFQRFSNKELQSSPGTEYSYSNSNYVILGMVIEKITGKSYDSVIKEGIFDPLGMQDSDIEVAFRIVENRSTGYELDQSQSLIYSPFFNTTNAFATGNITSTVSDLHLWDSALYSDKFISPSLKSKMYKPILYNSQYGYGWFIQDTPFGLVALHSGGSLVIPQCF